MTIKEKTVEPFDFSFFEIGGRVTALSSSNKNDLSSIFKIGCFLIILIYQP